MTVAGEDLPGTLRVVGPLGTEIAHQQRGGESRVTLRTHGGAAVLPEAIRRLEAGGIGVREATLHQPTLDDVFLALTGRSLREEEAAA